MADLHDIFEEAKRVTRLHAQAVAPGAVVTPEPHGETIHVLPGQVYVLCLNDLILGVLAVDQKAIDEAHSLMHAKGGDWRELQPQRRWESGFSTVHISVHDVR